MKLTRNYLRRLIKEELDRHEEGEDLLRKFQEENPGSKPTEEELRRLADRMGLRDDAVSDAMGLAGYGKVHSDS
tara:strand:+ start:355 stop:576 length:222 start_codon:yes stop_codon:yes gene_type:complete